MINIEPYKETLIGWKTTFYLYKWKEKSTNEKVNDLTELAYSIYYQNPLQQERMLSVIKRDRYAYHIPSNTIILNENKASILSTLHETGHAIFGPSELHACAFSIKLFREIFPKEYNKLTWSGHMVIKKPN